MRNRGDLKKKCNENSNYRENMLPINLDDDSWPANVVDKVWTEIKATWKYNMCVPFVDKCKWILTLKKLSRSLRGGTLSPHTGRLGALSIYTYKIIHVRNTHGVFSCGLHFSTDICICRVFDHYLPHSSNNCMVHTEICLIGWRKRQWDMPLYCCEATVPAFDYSVLVWHLAEILQLSELWRCMKRIA